MQINNRKHQHVVSANDLPVPSQGVDVKVPFGFPAENNAMFTLSKFRRGKDVDELLMCWLAEMLRWPDLSIDQPLNSYTGVSLSWHNDRSPLTNGRVRAKQEIENDMNDPIVEIQIASAFLDAVLSPEREDGYTFGVCSSTKDEATKSKFDRCAFKTSVGGGTVHRYRHINWKLTIISLLHSKVK